MLYMFAFERVGVVVSDLYFLDPQPAEGQEGAEHGVRLEVRLVDRPPLRGSIYSAQPIAVEEPVWRADLLESVAGATGSFDRTHHHPRFKGYEPSRLNFVEEMTASPVEWVGEQLSDLDALLERAGVDRSRVDPDDARQLRDAVPEIKTVVASLLERVHAGELATPPAEDAEAVRRSWL